MSSFVVTTLFVISTAMAAEPPRAPLGPTPAEQQEINRQIQNLGHSDFNIRDEAYRKLSEWSGLAYRSLLEAERKSTDAETRHRCSLLIPNARIANVHSRIEAFLADANGEFTHDLPGFERFLIATKGIPSARKTFAEMLQNPSMQKLLLIAEADRSAIPAAVVQRATELQYRPTRTMQAPPAGLIVGNAAVRPAAVQTATTGNPTNHEIWGLFFFDSLTPRVSQTRRGGVGPLTLLNQVMISYS